MTLTGFLVRYIRCQSGSFRALPTATEAVATVPLRMFTTRAAAEAYRDELHRQARRTLNPFAVLSDPWEIEVLAERLRALAVPFATMPCGEPERSAYRDWYDAEAAHLCDAERASVWSCFNSGLYDVAEATWDE